MSDQPEAESGPFRDPARPVEERVEDLLRRMTLAEKVEQMSGLQMESIDGLYHTPANARLGIPGFRMVDGPRGVRAGKTTAFPVGMARGATFDPALERRVGEAIGVETLARGGNVVLAPVVNLLRHPRWGRAQETYGEDSHHLGVMGAAFVEGAQRHVVASVKHYAVNSIENNRFTVSANLSERTLREVYLPHFRKTVEAGVGSVMSAYNRVGGTWCSEHPLLLREILKGEWGFDGFVESDWIFGMHDTAASVRAGLDVEMPCAKVYGERLLAAVESGAVSEADVDDAVRRILRIMLRFGVFDGPLPLDPTIVACAEHAALAREVARKGIVLLKNDGALLPLDRASTRRIAVVGALAGERNLGDRGSSYVSPPYAVTPLAGLEERAHGFTLDVVASDAPSADELARIAQADVAIVVAGLTSQDEGEGQITAGDRTRLELSDEHERLILDVARTNPRTVVVLEGGSAIVVERWVERVPALLMAWYPGMEGGHAIAEVLLGEVNPSGRLPITFARSEDQLPPWANDHDEVEYGFLHGYRLLDHAGEEPRFPFGFGLSYTSFAYRSLTLEADAIPRDGGLRARVEVANTGAVAGDEVVQLYVGAERSRVERAPRDLRAFARVHLAPGEAATVVLDVPAADLAYWDEDAHAWRLEDVEYTAWAGASSRDLPLRASFRVAR
ncbi:MAG: glycoside hydrolase family 3 C-terminal domain-containing protein [Thermodesulfobacteriota bacterium]